MNVLRACWEKLSKPENILANNFAVTDHMEICDPAYQVKFPVVTKIL